MQKNLSTEIRSYIGITFGLFLYAFSWIAFLIPNEIVGGGATGVATVVYYLTGKLIPIEYGFFGLNVILVVIGTSILGRGFGAKTIYGIIFTFLMLRYCPAPAFITESFHESDKLICAIIGGFISGLGIAITFMNGGSAGGTDIVAMIVNKYRNITPGKIFLYADLIIIGSSFFINWDFRTIVYGYVVMAVFSYSVDLFLSGSKQSVQLLIFSKLHTQIANRISSDAQRGVTVVPSMGWYSKEDGKLLIVVVRKQEMSHIQHIIKEVDPGAFITVASVMGVYGKGFETMKVKNKKRRKSINIS